MCLERYNIIQVLRRTKKSRKDDFLFFKSQNFYSSSLFSSHKLGSDKSFGAGILPIEKLNSSFDFSVKYMGTKYQHNLTINEPTLDPHLPTRSCSTSKITNIGHKVKTEKNTKEQFKFSISKIKIDRKKFQSEDIRTFGKLRKINEFDHIVGILSLTLLILSFASISLQIVDCELSIQKLIRYSTSIKLCHSILCCILALLLLIKYRLQYAINRMRHLLPQRESIWNSMELPYVIAQALICLVHLPPYIRMNIGFERAIVFCSFVKIYLIFPFILSRSPINSNKGKFVGSLRGIKYSKAFLLKTWIQRNHLCWLGFLLFVFVLLMGYLLYYCEHSYAREIVGFNYSPNSSISTYLISVWFLSNTYFTSKFIDLVGYGDYIVYSIEGRVICIAVMLGGIIANATTVGMILQFFQLSKEEEAVPFLYRYSHSLMIDILKNQKENWLSC